MHHIKKSSKQSNNETITSNYFISPQHDQPALLTLLARTPQTSASIMSSEEARPPLPHHQHPTNAWHDGHDTVSYYNRVPIPQPFQPTKLRRKGRLVPDRIQNDEARENYDIIPNTDHLLVHLDPIYGTRYYG